MEKNLKTLKREELRLAIKNLHKKLGENYIFMIETNDGNIYVGAIKLNDNKIEIVESPKDRELISYECIVSITPKSTLELAGIINTMRGHMSLHCEAIETAVKGMSKSMKEMGLSL